MGSHPINLALRFILELAVLASVGTWGWKQSDGWFRYALAIGNPILLAAIWGTFAVPEDPSRSGAAPIVTPGIIRLGIELAFFTIASLALYDMGQNRLCFILASTVLAHYIISYDRILWLLNH